MHQGEEVLAPGQPIQRKAGLDRGVRLTVGDDVPQQLEVAVEPASGHQQMAQLAVVDAHVGIDQIVRRRFVRNGPVQVVEHHVGVVEVVRGALGEPVAVVPLAHHGHRLVHVLTEHAVVAVRLQHRPHLCRGEAEQLVELRLQADVRADVEARGHVVHRDRRDAGDEHALDAASVAGAGLEGGEEAAVEAAAVGERLVRFRPAVRQYRVGEVVVLVDQHVQRDDVLPGVLEQLVQLAVDRGVGEDAVDHRFGKQVPIPFQRAAQLDEAVGLEPFPQGLQGVVERREVEAEDDVAVAVRRGLPPDVGSGEEGLEPIGAVAVVVALQQRHPARLAESARPDEEGVARVLQLVQKARLVDIEAALGPYRLEVRPAVGDLRERGWHADRSLPYHAPCCVRGPSDRLP